MSEIEKLYKNVEVIKKRECEYNSESCERQDFIPCELCAIQKEMIYPPFTAEKQLELIKWLIRNHKYFVFVVDVSNFVETLAKFINELAKDNWLTLEEKQQVKEILE